jgi:predicted ATPase
LQEVLDQPIVFKAEASFRNGATSVEFAIERNGHIEDIMKGQGGSVANVVSVGLRMFAVTMLDEAIHRRFLVLDEQDCWLHPDLVPRLVKIVHDAGTALGFQVLMISHHDVNSFIRYADRVYRMSPDRGDGVKLERIEDDSAVVEDEHAS